MKRLLGLLSFLFGLALAAMGVGPDEAEINLCKWPRKLFANVPDACLHGIPSWALYLVALLLIIGGIAWLVWPTSDRAKLTVRAPYLRQASKRNSWIVAVHNHSPVAAANVVMRLTGINPSPRYPMWSGAYPYLVQRDQPALQLGQCQINPRDKEHYRIITGWPNNGDFYVQGLDTKTSVVSGFDNYIRIEPEERWKLEYELTASNAKPVRFSLEVWVDLQSRSVMMRPVR
jgi:hypothetical protein